MSRRLIMAAISVIIGIGLWAEDVAVFAQLGHNDVIRSLAISPDGRYVLSGSWDHSLKLWDFETGREIRTLTSHQASVWSVCFSPDGRKALSGGGDGSLHLWDVMSGKVERIFWGHGHQVFSVAYTPDGKHAVSGSGDHTVKMWDLSSGKVIHTMSGHSDRVHALAVSIDGKIAVSGSVDKTMRFWDLAQGYESGEILDLESGVNCLAYSQDGRYLAAGLNDDSIILWDAKTRREIRRMRHGDSVSVIQFSADGARILSGGSNLKLWDTDTGNLVNTYTGISNDQIVGAALSPDGRYAVGGGWDDKLTKWNLSTGEEVSAFKQYSERVTSVSISSDGRYALLGSRIAPVKLWDLPLGRQIRTYGADNPYYWSKVCFSPDGKYALGGHESGLITMWDTFTGDVVKEYSSHTDEIRTLTFSSDGKRFLSGCTDGLMKLWSVSTGEVIHSFGCGGDTPKDEDRPSSVTAAVFSVDGKMALSAAECSPIILWDLGSGRQIKQFYDTDALINAAHFTSDGKSIVAAGWHIVGNSSQPSIFRWDIASGERLRVDSPVVLDIVPLDDPRLLLTGDGDGNIRRWNIVEGYVVEVFRGHQGVVRSIALSSDQKRVISGSEDGSMRYWDLTTATELLQMVSLNNGEWVSLIPEGYYNASNDGAKYLNVRIQNTVYSMDNFFETYYRPDIIQAKAAGRDLSALIGNTINSTSLPPEVIIQYQTTAGGWVIPVQNIQDIMIRDGNIRIRILGRDVGGGIREIRLFVNGKIWVAEERGLRPSGEQDFSKEYAVALTSGENAIMAVAFSRDMVQGNPALMRVFYTPPVIKKPDIYILAVGIDKYKNSRYDLNYAVADCHGFIGALRKPAARVFDAVNVITLTDAQATRATILSQMNQFASIMKADDMFIFYYAGHGIALPVDQGAYEYFFILHEVTQMTDIGQCRKDALSEKELREQLRLIKANKQMLFIDACNAGAFAMSFALRGAAEENALAKLSRSTGISIYASATSEQLASEFKDLGHGIFTYSLIEALSGSALNAERQITNNSIKSYLDIRVPQLTKQYKGGEQYPTTFMTGQEYPIGLP